MKMPPPVLHTQAHPRVYKQACDLRDILDEIVAACEQQRAPSTRVQAMLASGTLAAEASYLSILYALEFEEKQERGGRAHA